MNLVSYCEVNLLHIGFFSIL